MAAQKVVLERYPLISIVVPTYHSEKTLPDTLSSVFQQTYQHWQLIICDDGTNGFEQKEVEEQIQGQLPKACSVVVIHQPENIGTVRNLNAGLRVATGEWVMLLAADDVLAETRTLEKLATIAVDTMKSWIVSRTELCDSFLAHTGKFSPVDIHELRQETAAGLYGRLCTGCMFPSTGNLYQRTLLAELGGFDEAYRLVEDWPTFLKLTRAGIIPEFCTDVSVLHRGGGVSWSNAAQNRIYQKDLIETMHREVLPYIERLPEKERALIQQRCEDKLAVYVYRFEKRGLWSRLKWLFQHGGVVARKLVERA